jgi:GNAT superfamily N-acetyltransferase
MSKDTDRAYPGLDIRIAAPEDAEGIANLSAQLGYPTSPREAEIRLAEIRGSQEQEVFIATSPRGEVMGWIHVFCALRLMTEPFAELGGLIVDEGRRGQGIGKSLLHKAERWAQERGARSFRIRAGSTRAGAHRFYAALDYEKVKSQEIFEKVL